MKKLTIRSAFIIKPLVKIFLFFLCLLVMLRLFLGCVTVPKNPPIVDLLQEGKKEELEAMLTEENVNSKDKDGQTLLHLASKQNNLETVAVLIKKDAKIDAVDATGKTPLLVALERRNLNVAEFLAGQEASIFIEDNQGASPFSYAKEVAILPHILNSKTVNQKNKEGKTPLHLAIESYDVGLTKHILDLSLPSIGLKANGDSLLSIAYAKPEKKEAAIIASLLLLAGVEPLYEDFKEFEKATIQRNYATRFQDGMTVLHIAVAREHAGFVQFLIDSGVPIDAQNTSKSTALHEAVRRGNVEIISMLLKAGANPAITDVQGNSALHIVVPKEKRLEVFQQLLASVSTPNIKDSFGETPLHIATRLKYELPIIKLFIAKGAALEEKNKRGESVLFIAVQSEQVELIKYFASIGGNIHSQTLDGNTPIILSFTKSFETFSSLLTEKNIYSKDTTGDSILHIAIKKNAKPETIPYIIEHSNLISESNIRGDTPLHVAVSLDNAVLGEILIEKHADIFVNNDAGYTPFTLAVELGGKRGEWFFTETTMSARDVNGNTALHVAAQMGYASVIRAMVSKGASITATNKNNETPIFSALKQDAYNVIRTLLSLSNNQLSYISKRDFLGNTSLHIAVKMKAYNSAKLLLSTAQGSHPFINLTNQTGSTALHEAASLGDETLIKLLLAYNADITAQDNSGKSPLSRAIIANHIEAARLLLVSGSSPVQQDMNGITPLHEAISIVQNIYDKNTALQIIKMIRQAGGNPMARDAQGRTPLSMSLEKDVAIIQAVLGNDKFLSDSDGRSPLHLAIIENVKVPILNFLLRKDYPINKRDRQGETALFYAIDRLQAENAKLLFDRGADPFISNNTGENVVTLIFKKREAFIELLAKSCLIKSDAIGDNLLHYAARFANKKIIETLLSVSTDGLDERNTLGETPYDVALHWQKGEIASLFEKKHAVDTKEASKEEKLKLEENKQEATKTDSSKKEVIKE